MKTLKIEMRVYIPGIVATARRNKWSAEQLAQSFNEMPPSVAQRILDYEVDLDEDGNEVPSALSEHLEDRENEYFDRM